MLIMYLSTITSINKVNSLIMSYVPIKKLYMQQQKYFALVNYSYTKLHLVEEQAF